MPSMLQCVITQKQLEAITDIISLLSRAQKSPGDLNSFQTNLQIIYPLVNWLTRDQEIVALVQAGRKILLKCQIIKKVD